MVDSSSQHLLAEGHHVRGLGKVKVFVGPHFAGRTAAGLDLVDEEGCVVLGAQLLKALK